MNPHPHPLSQQRYRPRRWIRASTMLLGGSLVAALLVLLLVPSLVSGREPSTPTPPRPDGVLLVGDSLLYQSRAEIDSHFDEVGVATGWIGGPGEGLLTRQSSWLDQIDQAIETFDPDAVVIEACCNYAQHDDHELYRLPDGTAVERDTELMYALWEQAARDAVARAGSAGAEVHVVIAPPPVEGSFFDLIVGGRMDRFASTWRAIASDTPGLHVIDWTSGFADEGQMVSVLPGIGQVRSDDGLHIVGAGHDLVAGRTVAAVLDGHARAEAKAAAAG